MPNIAIVGEAWGVEEEKRRTPFIGPSGLLLTAMLADAGIDRGQCLLTNVFNLHPPGNDINELCGPKDSALPGYPAHHGSRHVRQEFATELDRLGDELVDADPNVIIALGNTAMWALLGHGAIAKYRGTVGVSTHTAAGFKVLPTYHPAAVVRQLELRPVTVLDFAKALRESESPDLHRPSRLIHIPETIEDIYDYDRHHLQPTERIAVDIETAGNQVTCIGFAPSWASCLVIPFTDARRKARSYFLNRDDELRAWRFVRDLCTRPTPKTFQNGLYDIAFLWRACGIRVKGADHDTMLLHHALQPESPKALGFLGSVYTDEGAWKQLRGSTKTIKRDE